MFTIWFNGKWSNNYQFSITYIQKLLKKYYNNGPLNAEIMILSFLVLNFQRLATWYPVYIIYIYIYIKKAIDYIY